MVLVRGKDKAQKRLYTKRLGIDEKTKEMRKMHIQILRRFWSEVEPFWNHMSRCVKEGRVEYHWNTEIKEK